jgi:hypothetical protein
MPGIQSGFFIYNRLRILFCFGFSSQKDKFMTFAFFLVKNMEFGALRPVKMALFGEF